MKENIGNIFGVKQVRNFFFFFFFSKRFERKIRQLQKLIDKVSFLSGIANKNRNVFLRKSFVKTCLIRSTIYKVNDTNSDNCTLYTFLNWHYQTFGCS